ncbi:hypothetical protein CCUS01_12018 [Colletotrichum cuscutae]|uniref:Uncharacterized protein n=1 Tax=Colletotrichum cuscutae TaxID=1209917 RepID=A0AAI9TY91_9PEZI|nr:hypothetical protein CCUS01_12018 [Colletotrichum cuscutae]
MSRRVSSTQKCCAGSCIGCCGVIESEEDSTSLGTCVLCK